MKNYLTTWSREKFNNRSIVVDDVGTISPHLKEFFVKALFDLYLADYGWNPAILYVYTETGKYRGSVDRDVIQTNFLEGSLKEIFDTHLRIYEAFGWFKDT